MAVEAKRGCGYRKVGGLYIVGGKPGDGCCKLPIPLHICPTCAQGIKQTRGWTWIDPRPWLAAPCTVNQSRCPAAHPELLGDRVGLLWIGRSFYPTPGAFMHEATIHGVSRRITGVPRNFKFGDWVFLAHPEAVWIEEHKGPGIFTMFQPTAFEKIVTQTQARDSEYMADLAKRKIDAVVVPDDDKDHQGTVYDEAEDPELPLDLHRDTGAEEEHAS